MSCTTHRNSRGQVKRLRVEREDSLTLSVVSITCSLTKDLRIRHILRLRIEVQDRTSSVYIVG